MRRLTETDRNDSGVATIFVVLAMTAMVVGAAFAIDVGGYVAGARSAQNSADATVLAVATDCALRDAPIDDYSQYRKEGQTITAPYCNLAEGETNITVTKEVDGLLLAQSAGDVNRTAWARWGTLATATTAPVIIADCEFRRALFGNLNEPKDDVIVYLDSPPDGFGCSQPLVDSAYSKHRRATRARSRSLRANQRLAKQRGNPETRSNQSLNLALSHCPNRS
jgi:Flp pilus assembly protein TadG